MFRVAIPVLHVSSSGSAEEFYCGKLGFTQEFAYRPGEGKDPCYMGLIRDDAMLHVSSFAEDGVPGSLVFLVVDDVDELYKELQGRGVAIAMPPTDQTWGNREMYVLDADRNRIAFVHRRKS